MHVLDDERAVAAKSIARIRPLEVQRRRQLLVMQGERRLDQSGHAGGGFQMAEVRLHRAERSRYRCAAVRSRKAAVSAATSIGSPSGVPVPWAST